MPKPALVSKPKPKPMPPPTPSPAPEEVESSPKRRRYADNSRLPLISVIEDQPTMDRARELLEQAEQYKAMEDKAKAELDAIKAELVLIAQAFELPGMRFGKFGCEYNGTKRSHTLDKGKLLENGVTPEQINASMAESREWEDLRFVRFTD